MSVFDVLSLMEKRGIVKMTGKSSAYCVCCGSHHLRDWFRNERTGDSFYICIPKMMGMINYACSGWKQTTLMELVNKLI